MYVVTLNKLAMYRASQSVYKCTFRRCMQGVLKEPARSDKFANMYMVCWPDSHNTELVHRVWYACRIGPERD